MRTAFVFAGGGSLGSVQVGMLRALVRSGVTPDLVVGASVGAINAAHFAGRPDAKGVERLAEIWRQVTRRQIFPLTFGRGLLGLLAGSGSFIQAHGLRRLITSHVPYERLEKAVLPCIVVATDLVTGREVGFSNGAVVELLLASAAIPGVFRPVEIAGRAYVDGGVASNTPIAAAVRAGAQRIVVLTTGFTCDAKSVRLGALAVAIQSLNHMIGRQLTRDFERFARDAELFIVPPVCPVPVSAYDFSRTAELMDRAEQGTRRWLESGGLDRPSEPLSLEAEGIWPLAS